MYNPAVTIVAAWIRAETGVGPSIASGSQTNSGICADLPVAPRKSNRVIMVTRPPACSSLEAASELTVLKSMAELPNQNLVVIGAGAKVDGQVLVRNDKIRTR